MTSVTTALYTIREWNESDPYREYRYKNHDLYNRKPTIDDLETFKKNVSLDFYGASNLEELLTTGKTGNATRGFEIAQVPLTNIDLLKLLPGKTISHTFWN